MDAPIPLSSLPGPEHWMDRREEQRAVTAGSRPGRAALGYSSHVVGTLLGRWSELGTVRPLSGASDGRVVTIVDIQVDPGT
ncbi:MAG: hypothetical protein K0S70_831 [Microbacterium sp.]|jgi:hypothetical protein|nr:hypothetical protein [Microbacterium sp.]